MRAAHLIFTGYARCRAMLVFAVIACVCMLIACTKSQVPDGFDNLLTGKGIVTEMEEGSSIIFDLGTEKEISCLRIVLSENEVSRVTVALSPDGEAYTDVYDLQNVLYQADHTIRLSSPARGRYLAISFSGKATVEKAEAYATDPWQEIFALLTPVIVSKDGKRSLVLEGLPKGVRAEFAGCSLTQVIGEDGTVHDNIEEKTVAVGYRLSCNGWTQETPDLWVSVPAVTSVPETDDGTPDIFAGDASDPVNEKPHVIPALQEWAGGTGERLIDPETEVVCRIVQDVSLGEEGYRITIPAEGEVLAEAYTQQGLIWARQTILQLSEDGDARGKATLPCGIIRDYPAYEVRGFEIDVARNFVSLDMLRKIADELLRYKCNELVLHLNDNELLIYSGKLSSREEALTAYAAFRPESAITGKDGMPLTAQDLYYPSDDLAALVRDLAGMGIRVIPEIDTPAHCLSVTRLYPHLALPGDSTPQIVEMMDISKEESVNLLHAIWDEQLAQGAAFHACDTVHVGGDEYYGHANDYLRYMSGLVTKMRETGRSVRLWASISHLHGTLRLPADGVQMCIWNTEWADPRYLYEAGFDLINTSGNLLYIIPGGGYDYPDTVAVELGFFVNRYATGGELTLTPENEVPVEEILLPTHSPRLKGACFVLWNDFGKGALDIGLTDEDMFDRILPMLPVFSEKTWNQP